VGHTVVPLSKSIGLDTPQLGLMMVLNLGSGLYTLPVGTTLVISSFMARSTMNETVKACGHVSGSPSPSYSRTATSPR
jgi:TRAP-type C4-dicarboxylate transport system permease large subunit